MMMCWLGDATPRFTVTDISTKYGRRAFAVAAPTVWNSLPDNLWDPEVTIDNVTTSVVFEAEASGGGGSKADGLPHPSLSPFPPLPFPFLLSFQTNQWEGRSDPVRGKFPGFRIYKYHRGYYGQLQAVVENVFVLSAISALDVSRR